MADIHIRRIEVEKQRVSQLAAWLMQPLRNSARHTRKYIHSETLFVVTLRSPEWPVVLKNPRRCVTTTLTMFVVIVLLFVTAQAVVNSTESDSQRSDPKCIGRPHYNVSLTAYYPDFNTGNESDYLDCRGKKLRTLQNFLDGRCDYVTVGIDENLNLNYGSVICVPELNQHFGRYIPLQVRDHGENLRGHGFTRLDICVRSEEDSYDKAVNRIATVYA